MLVLQAKSQNRDEDWLLNMSMFDKVLSNLKEVKTEHKNSSNGAAELKDKVVMVCWASSIFVVNLAGCLCSGYCSNILLVVSSTWWPQPQSGFPISNASKKWLGSSLTLLVIVDDG